MKTPTTINKEFSWPVRVYYEDTDAAGVVYHSKYLNFMERARTEWLRQIGYSQTRLANEEGIVFIVSDLNIKYIKPAYFDELLDVNSRTIDVDGAILKFEQSIINPSNELICQANVSIACIDTNSFRPKRLPSSMKAKFDHVN